MTIASSYADEYGGSLVTQAGQVILFLVPTSSPALLAQIQNAGLASVVGIEYVQHSFADLEQLTLQIADEAGALDAAGLHLVRWGPDPQTNRVELALETYSDTAANSLIARYGPDWVSIYPGSFPTIAPALDRFSDVSPFFGGDRLFNSSNRLCTGGANLLNNSTGKKYVLTAGHCYGVGVTVYTNNSNQQTVGSVSSKIYGGGSIDAEIIPSSTSGSLWGNSGTAYHVKGAIEVGVGGTVCYDGATTGENCSDTISQYDICVNYDNHNVCHVAEATNSNHTVCQGGDSGGPVYQKVTGGVNVAGEIVATVTGNHTCYHVLMGFIDADFNVYPQTS